MLDSRVIPIVIPISPNQAHVPNAIYKYALEHGNHKRTTLAGVLLPDPNSKPVYLFWMSNEELLQVHGVGNGEIPLFSVTKTPLESHYLKINVTRKQFVLATDEEDCIHFPSEMGLFASIGQVTQPNNNKKAA